ncbi:hypothetical protein [Kitasatospora viridis]|uniref:Uncharacterized protein n=1 Tax=Kitasatospora viridis TaxID=281105 RepID=A0A561SA16_9ACTN|nr:hypothetical protein [Kitasatospora viridis]TWF71645.1 hypothetical protein FHX73_1816 [Kitasatospora viridis]
MAAGVDPERVFADEVREWRPENDDDVDFDYSGVDWDESASISDWDRMQAAMSNNRRVTVRDTYDPADAPVLADDPTDREWT